MNYKKIIKSQDTRFKILNLLSFIPDKIMIAFQYRIKMGRKLNLSNPQRYSEKLQWYKLYYRNPLMTQCADKYSVREYIKSKGFEGILNELYAVYNSASEVDFDSLPEKFVIKTTNGSGTNIFCKDKAKLDINEVKEKLAKWIKRDTYSSGREWCYKNIKPKIIIEEYLEDQANPFQGINDYKFICFNGKVQYIVLDVDRHTNHKRNIYDAEWGFLNVSTDYPNLGDCVPRPVGLDEMLEVATTLSKDFPCVRVDLYWINGRIYFGELTFYPWTGYVSFNPDNFDYEVGRHFILPESQV